MQHALPDKDLLRPATNKFHSFRIIFPAPPLPFHGSKTASVITIRTHDLLYDRYITCEKNNNNVYAQVELR